MYPRTDAHCLALSRLLLRQNTKRTQSLDKKSNGVLSLRPPQTCVRCSSQCLAVSVTESFEATDVIQCCLQRFSIQHCLYVARLLSELPRNQ